MEGSQPPTTSRPGEVIRYSSSKTYIGKVDEVIVRQGIYFSISLTNTNIFLQIPINFPPTQFIKALYITGSTL